ncbi:hypothetical protein J6590_016982 [Homalodisca vitripennis]|nr:hypothetical protein J6590_016982 [Homalodisca vitripennis]
MAGHKRSSLSTADIRGMLRRPCATNISNGVFPDPYHLRNKADIMWMSHCSFTVVVACYVSDDHVMIPEDGGEMTMDAAFLLLLPSLHILDPRTSWSPHTQSPACVTECQICTIHD